MILPGDSRHYGQLIQPEKWEAIHHPVTCLGSPVRAKSNLLGKIWDDGIT